LNPVLASWSDPQYTWLGLHLWAAGMLAEVVRPIYASGECEIDLARRELRILGFPVPVGGRAFEIIEVLAESAGELVTKDELMDRIWPGAIVMENTLHVHTAAVRKALGLHRKLLKTESGRGYRLLGSWSIRRQGAATPAVSLQQIRISSETRRSNLPLTISRLVGRLDALHRIQNLVSAYRVVTLTGPGGIGKTSLAVEVGRHILGEFSDGGRFVELASLSDPALVPSMVAGVLGLKISGEISAETVARAVGGQHLLLMLDNCEHVSDAVATLAEMFVRLCPRTTILATSREILRIEGEHVYRVPPLEVPAVDEKESGHILEHSAVELFLDRGRGLDADFSSHSHDLLAIATICRHLDGIPLAIEFAAARAAALGIQSRGRGTARPLCPADRRPTHCDAATSDAACDAGLESRTSVRFGPMRAPPSGDICSGLFIGGRGRGDRRRGPRRGNRQRRCKARRKITGGH
jgi:DNA-binding winged helix-turn-helix (wHTH) protein